MSDALLVQKYGGSSVADVARIGAVDLRRDTLEEGVGGLVALLEFVADLLDVLREALLEGDDFRQGLTGGAQIAAE